MGDPQMTPPYPGGFGGKGMAGKPPMNSNVARIFQAASAVESQAQLPMKLRAKDLLGGWADSLGNAVHVFSTDAYEMRLMATLARPPRPDIHLCIRPVVAGGGWQCGNSILDPVWTSEKQLHWVTVDGRVSVWVRLYEETKEEAAPPPEKKEAPEATPEKKEVPEATSAEVAKEESPVVEAQPQDGTEEKVQEPEAPEAKAE